MQRIPTTIHGILDYLTVGTLIALPRVLRWPAMLTNMLTGMAAVTFVYSLFTRYELGLFRHLPMITHLRLDAINAFITLGAAVAFGRREKSVAPVLIGMGLFELGAATMTEPVANMDRPKALMRLEDASPIPGAGARLFPVEKDAGSLAGQG